MLKVMTWRRETRGRRREAGDATGLSRGAHVGCYKNDEKNFMDATGLPGGGSR